MARLIAPGGSVYFVSEPTFFNPLLRLAYGFCFGLDKATRRDKFLCFKRAGDSFEMPIQHTDLDIWRRHFEVEAIPYDFMFFTKIGHATRFGISALTAVDRIIEKLVPSVRRYSYEYDFVFRRKN